MIEDQLKNNFVVASLSYIRNTAHHRRHLPSGERRLRGRAIQELPAEETMVKPTTTPFTRPGINTPNPSIRGTSAETGVHGLIHTPQ